METIEHVAFTDALRGDLEDTILRMKPWAHETEEKAVSRGKTE